MLAQTDNPQVHPEGQKLLQAIKNHLSELQTLLNPESRHSPGEDEFYRFYHQSFKVYGLQAKTLQIVQLIEIIGQEAGLQQLNPLFRQIIQSGTGITFHSSHNLDWEVHTRPILEAYFHAREMLSLMAKYGIKLDYAPNSLPSGWGAVLYLYQIR
jgi:hypothetical protein